MSLLVPVGYQAMFNATQYEFDVNVLSPVGSTVFEALVITENPGDIAVVDIFHERLPVQFSFTLSNMMSTITLNTALDPNDEVVLYKFTLTSIVVISSGGTLNQVVNVILYEIGKLLHVMMTKLTFYYFVAPLI